MPLEALRGVGAYLFSTRLGTTGTFINAFDFNESVFFASFFQAQFAIEGRAWIASKQQLYTWSTNCWIIVC